MHAHSSEPATDSTPTAWGRIAGIAVGLSVVVGVILLAFSWPAVTASPTDLPIGVVGADAQVEQVGEAIDAQADGAIALERFDDREAAVTAIEERDVYGAVVLGAGPTDAPEVLTASAANAQVAQLLGGIAAQLQDQIDAQIRMMIEQNVAEAQASAAEQIQAAVQAAVQAVQQGQQPTLPQPPASGASPALEIPVVTVQVTDVVPYPADDPNGAGLAVAMFPMVIGGMIGGIAIAMTVRGGIRRFVGVLIYAPAAGLLLAGILQGMYGALQGAYLLNASAIALAIAAIAATITGMAGLLGAPGAALGAITILLVGNPLSAATVPVEFLLSPWGAIGQFLPPGAAATLLRDLSYFPAADATQPWLVLAVWAVVGLALTLVDLPGRRAAASATRAEQPHDEPASAPA